MARKPDFFNYNMSLYEVRDLAPAAAWLLVPPPASPCYLPPG